MSGIRPIKKIIMSRTTSDGAGVKLKRVFSKELATLTDPFLLLDFFGSENPDDYIAGFPWHPHRGIETITYMLSGQVRHEDSLGSHGTIESGDCQWMTAGSGIIHQEMPERVEGSMMGFQLWANLPRSHKMIHPRYREIKSADIPEINTEEGIVVKIIAGKYNGVEGSVKEIITEPEYLDVSMPVDTEFRHVIDKEHTVFAYVFQGEGLVSQDQLVESDRLVLFGNGDEVVITTQDSPIRFLLISGKPIGEPIAWYGSIVMNTKEELEQAFREYQEGSFIKHK